VAGFFEAAAGLEGDKESRGGKGEGKKKKKEKRGPSQHRSPAVISIGVLSIVRARLMGQKETERKGKREKKKEKR